MSINIGITTVLTTLILLTTFSLSLFLLGNLKTILRDDLQLRLKNTLSLATLTLDGSLLPGLNDSSQESSADYQAVKKNLQAIKSTIADLHFVYTMRRDAQGKIIFVVDAETDPKTLSHIGDVYDTPTPTMLAAFDSQTPGQTFIEREPSPDEWGTWLSGFIVLSDGKGGTAGILGMDISATDIALAEWRAITVMLAVSVAVSLVVLLLGFFLARRITKPLKVLEADMERITKFQINEHTNVSSVFTEIRKMSNAVDNMKTSLRAFKRYVPADLVADLIILHQEAHLGGERRNLTILFSDIEGFTTWSEQLEPERLIQVMAGYFSGMTKIIHAHSGTVDKYIGDAIMAFWGAPAALDQHAQQAALAALECVQFQLEFNKELIKEGLAPLNTRFGINTGEVLVGNVGYEERLNYTVMGDQVNLASRLENLNKLYATKVIISENTRILLGDQFLVRPIDSVVVKGKTKGIAIYELLSDADAPPANQLIELAKVSARAYTLYSAGEWAKAATAYMEVLEKFPADVPAKLLYERCRKFMVEDPGPDWHGAIILREK